MLLLCHRKRTSMILVSLSENSLREKNWFLCAYGAYNVRSNWRCQFEMKETHKKDKDWKYVGQNLTNLTTNFKCPTAHTDPQIYFDNALLIKFSFSNLLPARHAACGMSFMKLSLVLGLHRKSLMSLMPCPTSPMSLTLRLKLSSVLVLLINSHCYWCCIAWASNA